MIQRIQSVYLALIVIIIAILCSINIINSIDVLETGVTNEYSLNLFYFSVKEGGILVQTQIQYGLIVISTIILTLTLTTLFGFKNRKKQMLYCKINLAAIIALILAFFTKAYLTIPNLNGDKLMLSSIIGITLLIFMLYLNYRALVLIKKDDNLVKSADRIR